MKATEIRELSQDEKQRKIADLKEELATMKVCP